MEKNSDGHSNYPTLMNDSEEFPKKKPLARNKGLGADVGETLPLAAPPKDGRVFFAHQKNGSANIAPDWQTLRPAAKCIAHQFFLVEG
ncbi:hypothetical protein CEXT_53881 [Caerostris extrusa]|uniref:Uncharacterized protein n=1 Tax=Caerostris extrusa TaxID=172846 RepID=A0AAV4TQ08_CAEEX|nr:hypothetical protein CEXT_53881 [Caerostris extrusa]